MYLKNKNEIESDKRNKEEKGQLDKYWERMQNDTEDYNNEDKYSRKRGKHF